VFARAHLDSIRSSPLTVGHPPGDAVTVDNWKDVSVGHVETAGQLTTDSALDGDGEEFVHSHLVASESGTIDRIIAKDLVEISCGYSLRIDPTPGVTDDGIEYDVVARGLINNHVALLESGKGRAGKDARILVDSKSDEESKMMDEKELLERMKKLETLVADAVSALEESKVALDKKDQEIGRLTAQVATLSERTVPNVDSVQAAIDLRDTARPMVGPKYSFQGKSERQIKLDAIGAVNSKIVIADDASDGFVDGVFQSLAADGRTKYDPPREDVTDAKEKTGARERFQARLRNEFPKDGDDK